ncbi:small conductance mechanosensitive channel [Corynebacterium appendicis CIP 107643]|uniref:Small conductance mechanosensitive channel n=1 Tax=Corynebacterium appendicis CIP 107643 TaxID=1161099 RepID=A0A1N7IU65_9CORY|nr:mechanosensitive ion channel family protein [Corynebacterium appendicis]WJY60959.1 putative MscS family protein YkuT [Corynebacterium appendicis CIP 107643]SIS40633.1 small conductance mechanosensitive channel [Corynebacterium appendicis CIP 107643]
MPFTLILEHAWRWLADTGINLALLIVLAMLVPRAGRLANRYAERQLADIKDAHEGKSSLAIAGVVIYIVQLLAYFLILVFFLQQIGFSLAGAAIPATVVSAAVGFGAQNIIADFVAGFFILSEKQYGVGDLVTFQISGTEVTGDVIQITMRATQIRTLEQNTVTIPNSTAQVCINNSNIWSRALVVVPVPLARSRDVDEVIARAERAARKALANPEIAPLIRGELLSQPGIEINPPNTVGMPWTLDIRFMVRCAPGDQFPVERALRVHILEEFFDEYGSQTKTQPLDDDATQSFPAVSTGRYKSGWSEDYSEAAEAGSTSRAAAATTELPAANATADTGSTAVISPVPGTESAGDAEVTSRAGVNPDPELSDHEEVAAEEDPAAADTKKKHHALGTFGGRVRASTGLLIAIFLGLLILRGMTLDGGDSSEARGGILAPPRSSTATSEAPDTSTRGTGTKDEPTSTSAPEDDSTATGQTGSENATAPAPAPAPGNQNNEQQRSGEQTAETTSPTRPTGEPTRESGSAPASTPRDNASPSPIA